MKALILLFSISLIAQGQTKHIAVIGTESEEEISIIEESLELTSGACPKPHFSCNQKFGLTQYKWHQAFFTFPSIVVVADYQMPFFQNKLKKKLQDGIQKFFLNPSLVYVVSTIPLVIQPLDDQEKLRAVEKLTHDSSASVIDIVRTMNAMESGSFLEHWRSVFPNAMIIGFEEGVQNVRPSLVEIFSNPKLHEYLHTVETSQVSANNSDFQELASRWMESSPQARLRLPTQIQRELSIQLNEVEEVHRQVQEVLRPDRQQYLKHLRGNTKRKLLSKLQPFITKEPLSSEIQVFLVSAGDIRHLKDGHHDGEHDDSNHNSHGNDH